MPKYLQKLEVKMLPHVFSIYVFDYSLKFSFLFISNLIYYLCIVNFYFFAERIYPMYWIIRTLYILKFLQ